MKRWSKAEPLLFRAGAVLLVLAVAAAFYGPALHRTPGIWPAPLDDVYIHFGFARSAALGHPFQWIPGNGYSSGGTSLTYPLVLAPGYLLGFRGANLGIFAALIACASLIDLCFSARELVFARGAPRWVAWASCALLLSVPLLDWSLFSGMETALFAALLGRALTALRRVETSSAAARSSAQLRVGIYGALLVATRPESVAFAFVAGVAAAHAARSLGTWSSLARALGPTFAFLGAQALANRAFTSEWSAAGAVRKLLTSNPYATPLDVAAEVIKNLIALRSMALESALGRYPLALIVPLLGVVAVLDPRSRRLSISLLAGAAAAILLVSLNNTARYQNLRYAAPSILMLLLAALLGLGAIARRRSPVLRASAVFAAVAAVLAPSRWFPTQIDHFARASANIAGQQVEVAARLAARTPRPRVLFVGDAGAIPYLSGIGAIDGLGLGGYRGLPFARASVHGNPAVVELIERLDDRERPDVLAVYPSWWAGLADVFGRRIDAVRIQDNVICAADEKVIYEADWSALAPAGEARADAVDAIDVADLVDERAHAYAAPFPRGGWVIGAVLLEAGGGAANSAANGVANGVANGAANSAANGAAASAASLESASPRLRFDAGRIVPEGRHESFQVRASVARGPATLAMRTDEGGEIALRIEVLRVRDSAVISATDSVVAPRIPDGAKRWFEATVPLPDVGGGDRVRIFAARGAWRNFHTWLLRSKRLSAASR